MTRTEFAREKSQYYDLMQNIVKIVKMGLFFNKNLLNQADSLWRNIDSRTYSILEL